MNLFLGFTQQWAAFIFVGVCCSVEQSIFYVTLNHQTSIRQNLPGRCLAVFKQLSGSCQAVVRQSSGSRLEVIRHSSGSRHVVVMQLAVSRQADSCQVSVNLQRLSGSSKSLISQQNNFLSIRSNFFISYFRKWLILLGLLFNFIQKSDSDSAVGVSVKTLRVEILFHIFSFIFSE